MHEQRLSPKTEIGRAPRKRSSFQFAVPCHGGGREFDSGRSCQSRCAGRLSTHIPAWSLQTLSATKRLFVRTAIFNIFQFHAGKGGPDLLQWKFPGVPCCHSMLIVILNLRLLHQKMILCFNCSGIGASAEIFVP